MMDAEAVGLRAMEWCAVLLHAYLLLAAAIVALSVGATLFGVQGGIGRLGFRTFYIQIVERVFAETNALEMQRRTTRDSPLSSRPSTPPKHNGSGGTCERAVTFRDTSVFIAQGLQSIVDDDLTKRFKAQKMPTWNMLARNHENVDEEIETSNLMLPYILGWGVRYMVFLPFRVVYLLVGVSTFLVSFAFLSLLSRQSVMRRFLERKVSFFVARCFALSWFAVIRSHDRENMPRSGICVANHTSPIDVIILANENCYSMVGQRHTGFIGMLQKTLSMAQTHIWFQRSEAKDRSLVQQKLEEHTIQENSNPILIFPEGTCINNSSVVMFKKGSFEVDTTIWPVSIKYNNTFGDCFWDSSKQSFVAHLWGLLTTWAVVADVWYLPPMTRNEGEKSIDFANRVKKKISAAGGLSDLHWDGMLKRSQLKQSFMVAQQQEFGERVRRRSAEVEKKV